MQKNGGYFGKGAGEVEAVQKSQDEVEESERVLRMNIGEWRFSCSASKRRAIKRTREPPS